MGVKCNLGMKCIQYILFIINFMFVMVGTLLITMASTVIVAYSEYETFIESSYFKPPQLLIAVGVIIILFSILGGVAAIKQSTLLIRLYCIFLVVLLVLEAAAAITTYVIRNNIYAQIDANMNAHLLNYKSSPVSQHAWDYMQQNLYCCGVYHPSNWAPIKVEGHEVHENMFNYTVPYSCCKDWFCNEIYELGCSSTLNSYIQNVAFTLVYITIGVKVAQFLGVIFARMLSTTIRRVKTEEEMERQQVRHMLYDQFTSDQEERESPIIMSAPSSTDA